MRFVESMRGWGAKKFVPRASRPAYSMIVQQAENLKTGLSQEAMSSVVSQMRGPSKGDDAAAIYDEMARNTFATRAEAIEVAGRLQTSAVIYLCFAALLIVLAAVFPGVVFKVCVFAMAFFFSAYAAFHHKSSREIREERLMSLYDSIMR